MRRVKVGHVVEALTAGHQALFHCITALSHTKVGARRGGSVPLAPVSCWNRVGHLFMDTITLGGKYPEDR